jgi:hypothetical protein
MAKRRIDPGNLFDRMESGISNKFSHERLPDWIEQNTYLAGRNFSFEGHEYQKFILSRKKPHRAVKKCSQLGISELKARVVLAMAYLIPGFNQILTLPTTGFANIFSKTRVAPIIQSSELLSDALDRINDSAELKQIGDSLIYIRGTFSANAAISVPADALYHDEVDFSDQETLTSFQSRLTHSKYKWRWNTSTPTVAGYGIDRDFRDTNRYVQVVRCCHCAHVFLPDYRSQVVVPDYSGDVFELDKSRLYRLPRWRDSYLGCPKCRKKVDLSPAYREWVCENPDIEYGGDGIQLTPFDGPTFITVPNLLEARTRYKRLTDFINFNLGLCHADADSGLSLVDFEVMCALEAFRGFGFVCGIDMGLICHLVVMQVGVEGKTIVQVLTCEVKKLEETLMKLNRRYSFISIVADAMPYTETVMRLQSVFPMLYGAIYVVKASMLPYALRDTEQADSKGVLEQRQIDINRNVSLDALMYEIRDQRIAMVTADSAEYLEDFSNHLVDMKRVKREIEDKQELVVWHKSEQGEDHFHHALHYANVASGFITVARQTLTVASAFGMGIRKLKGVSERV